ncbi:TIGR02117 family protein [Rhizorhapis sp.]|uniref:TIGR02117 family protein n=1 Tax=Rhizorhapis sp. TaxID=1968842 RepID=UPI002B4A3EE8|nr:TIGR02117 family protein [Rhizorhapis sp.]HKR15944.1 TIGR02117 family protein [Rhizorhapis sp.]
MAFSSTAKRPRTDKIRALVRTLTTTALTLLALLLVYCSAALIGSLLPSNAGWKEPRQGVRIFIYSNGVHTGLILPAQNEVQDWRRLVRSGDIRDPRYAASSHILFGWGEREFYLNTPRWSDVDPIIAVKALANGEHTLLHVDHIHAPRAAPDMRPLMISVHQYRRLSQQIEAYFRLDGGRPQPVQGYGPADVFYQSTGRYDLFRTCNEWTGAQLRRIGVRIGVWTPFSESVMWWF